LFTGLPVRSIPSASSMMDCVGLLLVRKSRRLDFFPLPKE
jgi:hypothetical protein